MQISRHWRLNATRYRLQGVRYEDGSVSLQDRPANIPTNETRTQETEQVEDARETRNETVAA